MTLSALRIVSQLSLKGAEIDTPNPKSMQVPFLIAGIIAILFSTVAMAIVPGMDWFRGTSEGLGAAVAQQQSSEMRVAQPAPSAAARARARTKCDECGVIESMRHVAPSGISPAIYEITVRMGDGSTQVVSDASPAKWRPGERNTLIGYRNQPGR